MRVDNALDVKYYMTLLVFDESRRKLVIIQLVMTEIMKSSGRPDIVVHLYKKCGGR